MNALMQKILGDAIEVEYSGKSKLNPAYNATTKDGGKTYLDPSGKDVTKDAQSNGTDNLYRQPTAGEKLLAPESAAQTAQLRDQFASDPTLKQRANDINLQVQAGNLSNEIAHKTLSDPNILSKVSYGADGKPDLDSLKAIISSSGGDLTSEGMNRASQAMQEGAAGVPGKQAGVASNLASANQTTSEATKEAAPSVGQGIINTAVTQAGVTGAERQALPYTTQQIGNTAQLGAEQSAGALARSPIEQSVATLKAEYDKLVTQGALSRVDADEAIKDYTSRVLSPAQLQAGVFSAEHPQAPFGSVNREVIAPSGQVSVQQNPLVSNTALLDSAKAGMTMGMLGQSGMLGQGQTVKLADGTTIPASVVGGISRPAGSVPPVFPSQQSQGVVPPAVQPTQPAPAIQNQPNIIQPSVSNQQPSPYGSSYQMNPYQAVQAQMMMQQQAQQRQAQAQELQMQQYNAAVNPNIQLPYNSGMILPAAQTAQAF